MKKLPLSLSAVALLTAFAAAEPSRVAINEAALLSNDARAARAVMDGGTADATVLAQAAPGMSPPPATLTPTGANPQLRAAPPAAPAKDEPGFFSKAWDSIKTPSVFVPVGTAIVFAAMGAMIAGPLGALTGLAIGGLFGFIFTKAL